MNAREATPAGRPAPNRLHSESSTSVIESRIAGGALETAVYEPRSTKRWRRTRDQLDELDQVLVGIVRAEHPLTVRRAFNVASTVGAIPKTEQGYAVAKRRMLALRRRQGPKFDPVALKVAVEVDSLLAGCTCRPDVVHRAWDHVDVGHDTGCPAEHAGHRGVLIVGGRIR